jgi:hypothetical protein
MTNIHGFGQNASGQNVPAFQFSILTCRPNLSATKTIKADGTEIPFGHAKHFQFKYLEIGTLEDFATVLGWLAGQRQRFIIRGQLLPGLTGWQRRLIYPKDSERATVACPARRWIPLDLDGVDVPCGLGAPDKLAEAGYFIRDKMLPCAFRGVRCVAAATASTGRKGPGVARLRLFFVLAEAADNEALVAWADELSQRQPGLRLDPSVMLANQAIYTARPVWDGYSDPVPSWGRVAVLDGIEDVAALDLPCGGRAKARHTGNVASMEGEIPAWMLGAAAQDAGRGVVALDTSDKAWGAIRRAFAALDGCGSGRRHRTLNKAAWELARLVNEGELSRELACKAFLEAAGGIDNSDGEYDAAAIERRVNDAFADVDRR